MRPRALFFATIVSALVVGLAGIFACGASDFDPVSVVSGVRVFGVRADKPYANPGETVTLETFATDGRKVKPLPLKIYWVPFVCLNPREDLYYLCFLPGPDGGIQGGSIIPVVSADAGLPDGGLPVAPGGLAGGLASLPTNIDVSSFLPQGNTFSFRMPENAVIERVGSTPYGLAIVFNIACAGQVRIRQREGSNPQQVPVRCTDESGDDLTPDDYVISINRVYSYPGAINTNPVIESVTLDGVPVDPNVGIELDRCVAAKRADCPAKKIDVKVAAASWELNTVGGEGASPREQIWVTYFSDIGQFKDAARLLYDSRAGRVSESDVEYRAPYEAGRGTVWAVVHDNRVGAAFLELPLRIR